jgi:hypothetical protein
VRVALFTPARPQMRAAIQSRSVSAQDDPFESLGRAIAKHATGVAHAPYLPNVDITDRHISLMSKTDITVVVVACRPTGVDDEEAASSLHDQMRFMQSVSRVSKGRMLCCIQCNATEHGIDPKYENVICCKTYEAYDLKSAAELLFGSVTVGL